MTAEARSLGHRLAVSVAAPTAAVALVLAAIEIVARGGGLPMFLPAPSDVLAAYTSQPSVLWANLWASAWKSATGFGIAVCLAFAAAAIGVVLAPLREPIYRTGVLVQSVPLIATTPLLVVWFGNTAKTHIIIATLASYFPMLVAAMQGFRSVDPARLELMTVVAASRLQVLRWLQFPHALPYLFAGLKVAAPLAVLGTITAEWTGADRGIGAMMLYALFSYNVAVVWLSVVAACALSATGFVLVAIAERTVVTWQQGLDTA